MAGIFNTIVVYPSITVKMFMNIFDCHWMYAKKNLLVLSVHLLFCLHFIDEN